jgi:multimeric flavodoxin WrbA
MAGGLKQFFDDLCLASWGKRKVTGKPYVAFVTHGGGGGAIKSVEKLAGDLKLVRVAESVLSQGAPSGAGAEASIALGRALAEHVTRTQ